MPFAAIPKTGPDVAHARLCDYTGTRRSFSWTAPRAELGQRHGGGQGFYPVPTSCACCGGELRKLGEDVTETLERVPASWSMIEHVREKMTCRRCEAITQPPAPFHPISRGRAGPNLLAEVAFGKFGLHLPLHRQSERFSCEGVPIDASTLADWVGTVTVSLQPLTEAIEAYIRSAARLHADDAAVPVLGRGKTRIGRLWTVVRDDRPFSGPDPPAAAYFYSPDRRGKHPESFLGSFTGILQADAYSSFGRLYEHGRQPGPMREAACWAHGRRNFFKLAVEKAPLAIEAVRASTPSRRSSARSTVSPPRRASPPAPSVHARWSTSSRSGCASSAASCRPRRIWPRRSATCSAVGHP